MQKPDVGRGAEFTFGRTFHSWRIYSTGVPENVPFTPSKGYFSGTYKPRTVTPSCIIVHETGPGPMRRYTAGGSTYISPTEAAVAIYKKFHGNNGPHYVVSDSSIIQMCPENYVAYHAGSSKYLLYKTGMWKTKKVQWWLDRWAAKSPIHLDGGRPWAGRSLNRNSIGIECVSGTDYKDNLIKLLISIRQAYANHGVMLGAYGHCDVDPLSRSNKYGQYDPDFKIFDPLAWSARNPPIPTIVVSRTNI